MNPINQLKALLSPTPRYFFQVSDGVEQSVAKRGRAYWVVSRALCHFQRMPAPKGVRGARRTNLIRLQIQSWSPYKNTGVYTHWVGGDISVWFWDQDAVLNAMQSIEADPKEFHVVPEPVLQPIPEEGITYIAGLEGFSAQVCKNHEVISSRWWKTEPSAQQWQDFLRTGHVDGTGKPAASERPAWLSAPWAKHEILDQFAFDVDTIRRYLPVFGLLLLAPLLFFMAKITHLGIAASVISVKSDKLSKTYGPLFNDKRQAEQNAIAIRKILEVAPYPQPLEILKLLAEKLPPTDARIVDIRFQKQMLTLTLISDQKLDATFFVRVFETIPLIENVSTEPGKQKNTLTLNMKVKKKWV